MHSYLLYTGTDTQRQGETHCYWTDWSEIWEKMFVKSMIPTLKVRNKPLSARICIWTIYLGRASGLIVDTPSSFASGPSSGSVNDHRHTLIKSCVDAFASVYLVVNSCDFSIVILVHSKHNPCCWSRKTQRWDAANIRQQVVGHQDSEIRRCMCDHRVTNNG